MIIQGKIPQAGNGLTSAQEALLNQIPNKQDKDQLAIDGDIAIFDNTETKSSGKQFNDAGHTADDIVSGLETDNRIAASVSGADHARGSYDASTGLYPSTGGSGVAGAIRLADYWYITVAGVIGNKTLGIGDTLYALANTPGQTDANWGASQGNLDYTAENVANKSSDGTFASADNIQYPTTLAVKTYADTKVSSVNGETGIVTLTQDDVLDGITYKQYSATEQTKLAGIQDGAEVNVQADWDQSDNTQDDYIKNKPTIPTQYTDEMAQDAVGGILTDTDTIDFSYDDLNNQIKADVRLQNTPSINLSSDVNGIKADANFGNITGTITEGNDARLGTKDIDEANIADNRIQVYNSISGKLEYQDFDKKQNIITATANSQSAMLALTNISVNDIILRTDLGNAQFQLTSLPTSNLSNWRQLSVSTPTPVISTTVDGIVNGGSSMPSVDGLYAIKLAPSSGLPIGSVGDILKRTSGVWTIDTTWAAAGASIYNLGDQKTYNKANVGFNTWNVGIAPLVYNVRATGDNSKSGGYTTLQNALNAYESDYGASLGTIGVVQIYDTNLSEVATWNPSNNAQNLIIIGIGDKYRSFTQITQIILGRNAHRVTLSKLLGSTSGTLPPFVVQCSGTINENGTVDTPRGKIIFDQCSISTNGNVGVDIQSCENFMVAANCDFSNKVINFTDIVPDTSKTAAQIQAQATTYTGILFKASDTGRYYKANGASWQIYNANFTLPLPLYLDNTQNAGINAGVNRFVTKNATCTNIIEISRNSNILEYGYVVGVLNADADYDAVLSLGAAANGYYLANFTRTKSVSAVNATSNTLTITGHGLSTGDLVSFTAATLPAPIVANKQYISVKIDNNTISIIDPLISGTPAVVDITGTTITTGVCTVFTAGNVLLRLNPNTVVDSQHYNADNTYYNAITQKTYTKKGGIFTEVQNVITGAATTIIANDLTVNRAVISNASGKIDISSVTSTELGYLSGATSTIQTQLNNKIATADFTAKGDILAGTGTGTYTNLPVGTDGQVLTADSAETSGVKWSAASGGFSVTQDSSTTTLNFNSFTTTGITNFTNASITLTNGPSNVSSPITTTLTLEVYSTADRIKQRLTIDNVEYVRSFVSSTWSNWEQIQTVFKKFEWTSHGKTSTDINKVYTSSGTGYIEVNFNTNTYSDYYILNEIIDTNTVIFATIGIGIVKPANSQALIGTVLQPFSNFIGQTLYGDINNPGQYVSTPATSGSGYNVPLIVPLSNGLINLVTPIPSPVSTSSVSSIDNSTKKVAVNEIVTASVISQLDGTNTNLTYNQIRGTYADGSVANVASVTYTISNHQFWNTTLGTITNGIPTDLTDYMFGILTSGSSPVVTDGIIAIPLSNWIELTTKPTTAVPGLLTSGKVGVLITGDKLKVYYNNGTIVQVVNFIPVGQFRRSGTTFINLVNYAVLANSNSEVINNYGIVSSYNSVGSVNHNIGGSNTLYTSLRCVTASNGYAVGDEIPFMQSSDFGQNAKNTWTNLLQSGYGMVWAGGATETPGHVIVKNSIAVAELTLANFNLIFKNQRTW